MKKIILFAIAIFPLVAFGQIQFDKKDAEMLKATSKYPLKQSLELTWQDEIQHTRYCLGQYRKEKLSGLWLTVGGGITAGLATGLYQADVIDETPAFIGYTAGGAMMITGYVMQLTCNRWLKKAAIGPADSGIGVKVSF